MVVWCSGGLVGWGSTHSVYSDVYSDGGKRYKNIAKIDRGSKLRPIVMVGETRGGLVNTKEYFNCNTVLQWKTLCISLFFQ
jgi:hypothetical protein